MTFRTRVGALALTFLAACSSSTSHDTAAGVPADGGGGDDTTNDGSTVSVIDGGTLLFRDAGPDATVPPPDGHVLGMSLSVGGKSRTYDLSVPSACTATTRVPIVILLHGDGGRGNDMYTSFPLEAAAHDSGDDAVFVYPDGLNTNQNGSAWNIYDDPGSFPYTMASPTGNEDVDFFDALIPAIAAMSACADSSRVYLTGFSNGGYMTTQVARWRSSVVTAAAPQSGGEPAGTEHTDYSPPNYCVAITGAVPILIIHGQSDDTVDPTLAEQNASYWDMANSCDQNAADCTANGNTLVAPPVTPSTAVDPSPCVSYSGCAAGKAVVFCFIPAMGHQIWSGAPSAIWAFFAANGAHG